MLFTRPVTRNSAAFVTGAGSGIGRAFAHEIARRGGRVACCDVDLVAARRVAKEIGGSARAFRLDVTDADAFASVAGKAEQWLGRPIDLVINNAGVAGGNGIGTMPLADWRWIIDVNLWGAIHGCHVFAPKLRAQGRGAILNVASSAAFLALPGIAAYNVSKAGVLSLSETLAAELSGTGVRVAVLCPTLVKTSITRNARAPSGQLAIAGKLMDRVGMSAEYVARYSLDGLDRNRFYLLPQADAKFFWLLKRHFPRLHTRLMGFVERHAGAWPGNGNGDDDT